MFDFTTKSIICTFCNQPSGIKHCTANITYGADCDQHIGIFRGMGTGVSVATSPLVLIGDITEYCFVVNTSSGAVTVFIEGTFQFDEISSGNHH